LITKPLIRKLQSKRPIREKQMSTRVTVAPRSKRTSERNCIQVPFEHGQKLEILLMPNSQLHIVEH
ncbi:hypothetical protein T10_10735, partial [Trichinella papuae]